MQQDLIVFLKKLHFILHETITFVSVHKNAIKQ